MNEPLVYSAADRDFFETPARIPDEDTRYPLGTGEVPAGWRRGARGLWTVLRPDGAVLPDQGWKIHLAATPRVAGTVLDRAAEILLRRRVVFKFLRSERALRLMSDKNMSRGSSGKFITVYPADEAELETLLGELTAAVGGMPGPYILSDLRIGDGPVHVRYGAFAELWCPGEDGLPEPALRDPSGELVPDVRGPVFRMPEWLTPPAVLEADLAARRAASFAGFPYRIEKALHFTNAGGIYRARHRETGREVVLREARPFAGIDRVADGVERLHREYRALMTLRGLPCVPEIYGLHTAWEHHYLAEEYIEGNTLFLEVVNRYPVVGRAADEEAMRSYAAWATRVIDNLTRALDAIHERGIAFRDVHPRNVIVRPDDSIVLVDFEFASDIESDDGLRIGARGFSAPAGATPREADAHALWATWLFTLMPMVEATTFGPGKPDQLEAAGRERFGLAPDSGPRRPVLASAGAAASVRHAEFTPGTWPEIRERLIAGIHATATPERDDRLFPGDWRLFQTGGHTLAHGAAGVILALHRVGADVPAEYVDWLIAAADRAEPESAYGLYDGLTGVAVVLDELGRHDDADAIRARLAEAGGEPLRPGYYGGRAGIGLSLCRTASRTGDPAPLEQAARIADRLAALVRDGSAEGLRLPTYAGLMFGMSGTALLQIRLHRITGEQRYLAAAREALAWDFERCVRMDDGTIQAKQGHRHLPYLDEGSIGIALVAREYLVHAEDPELTAFIAAAKPCSASPYVREPVLHRGRAGLVAALSILGDAADEAALLTSVRNLTWHAVPTDNGLYFPGSGLQRLSVDLGAGSAGVLLALHTVFEGKGDLDALLPLT
ncbi:MAG TPA: class III lanthionine synthetase LanKC [Actinospica sp.]|nr:class III lanthionine synthetase LanKC [Actinospica sp.]